MFEKKKIPEPCIFTASWWKCLLQVSNNEVELEMIENMNFLRADSCFYINYFENCEAMNLNFSAFQK